MPHFACECGIRMDVTAAMLPIRCRCRARVDSIDDPAIRPGPAPPRERKVPSPRSSGQRVRVSGAHPPLCIHRGRELRQVTCPGCCGGTRLKVFSCAKHGECTIVKSVDGVACCKTCPDRVASRRRESTDVRVHQGTHVPRSPVDKPREPIGAAQHRDGWPWVVGHLQRATACSQAVLIDDFVEQTFLHHRDSRPYARPWAGMFHYPPVPTWMSSQFEQLWQTSAFLDSLAHLRAAFTLSEHLAEVLRPRLPCPVVVLRYPQPTTVPQWTIDNFRGNVRAGSAAIFQSGWFLRNTRAIAQIPCSPHALREVSGFHHAERDGYVRGLRKVRFISKFSWTNGWDRQCQKYWADEGTREEFPFEELPFRSHAEYDTILAGGVGLLEFFACSGSTALVECVARTTPVLANRHPAVVEYLGERYPLYFDEPAEIPKLLDEERIVAAHEHLAAMDRTWLDPEVFVSQINDQIQMTND